MSNPSSVETQALAELAYRQWLVSAETQTLLRGLEGRREVILRDCENSLYAQDFDAALIRGRLHEARQLREVIDRIVNNNWN